MPELVTLRAGTLPGREVLARAAAAAGRGEVVAFPTDTLYGLGTSASSRPGVERLYRMKGRGQDKPLPLLAASTAQARRWVEWTPQAESLARRFWPGGLTLVLRASAEGRGLACCQGETLAVRVPGHPVALALLEASGLPWAQTSANASGQPPLPDGAAVARAFGGALALVIDAGPALGRESTVADARSEPVRVLREGAIPAAALLAGAAGPERVLFVCTGNSCRSVMAEFLWNRLARERGLTSRARSAGTAADPSFATPAGVRAALAAQGIADAEHRPQPVTQELLDWADLVLVMERRHRERLLELFPGAAAKIQALAGDADVADPIGQSDAAYAACCRDIRESLEAMLKPYEPNAQTSRP